jgi:hypothetical protein
VDADLMALRERLRATEEVIMDTMRTKSFGCKEGFE